LRRRPEAIAPGLGRLCVGAPDVAGVDEAVDAPGLPRSNNKLYRCRFRSRKRFLDVDNLRLDRVSLSTVACCLMVAPPRKTTPGQQAGEHQTDNRQPQRMRQVDDAAQHVGQWRWSATPSKHSGEDQKQRRSVITQVNSNKSGKCDERRCRPNRYRPCQSSPARPYSLDPGARFDEECLRRINLTNKTMLDNLG